MFAKRTWMMLWAAAASSWLLGCEDGPDHPFRPLDKRVDPGTQNGFRPGSPFTQPGERSFDQRFGTGDSDQRAQVCDQAETEIHLPTMVGAQIVPDKMLGGIPLWTAEEQSQKIDDLLGQSSDEELVAGLKLRYCDPGSLRFSGATVIYSWGPQQEVIAYVDRETGLIQALRANPGYLGGIEGEVEGLDGGQGSRVTLRPREFVDLGEGRLDKYASSAQAAREPRSWLNPHNVTRIYRMLRSQLPDMPALREGYSNCVQERNCTVLYTAPENQSQPQVTILQFPDVGVSLIFLPDGHLYSIEIAPLRAAPFERVTDGRPGLAAMSGEQGFAPSLASAVLPDCKLSLGPDAMTWSRFVTTCVTEPRANRDAVERRLRRARYDVYPLRDMVSVTFEGVIVTFRNPEGAPLLRDGSRPHDDAKVAGYQFTRSWNGVLQEYRPVELGRRFKERIENRLGDTIERSGFNLVVPPLASEPQRIGELVYDRDGQSSSWIPDVAEQLSSLYGTGESGVRDPRLLEEIFAAETFVDTVLDQLLPATGATGLSRHVQLDDGRKVASGRALFQYDGKPYRINLKYTTVFDALTAVVIGSGENAVDGLFDQIIDRITAVTASDQAPRQPYYTAEMLRLPPQRSPLALGSDAIRVDADQADRRLGMLPVTISGLGAGGAASRTLQLPGVPARDRAGYSRLLRPGAYEFVRAHLVSLPGLRTGVTVYVREADDKIGFVTLSAFEGTVELCPGLHVRRGDDLRAAVDAWAGVHSAAEYQSCQLVFGYSENGNVLDSVASVYNRISVSAEGGQASSVSIWQ